MTRLLITDKKNTCTHEFTIPGLDASFCGKCRKWVVTDKELCRLITYGKGKQTRRRKR